MATVKCEYSVANHGHHAVHLSPELTPLALGGLQPLTNMCHVPYPSAPGNWHSILYFCGFNIFSYLCPPVWGHDPCLIHHCASVPGTELSTGAQQIFVVTSNRINKSLGDKIKHWVTCTFIPFNFLLFVISLSITQD